MTKNNDGGMSVEDHYEVLDEVLTMILHSVGATIGDEQFVLLADYNRLLRNALGLPVERPN